MTGLRSLVVVLGDQLDLNAAAFDGFENDRDAVWMAEVTEEATHVWSSKHRIVMFLSAMRHFAAELEACGRPLHYTRLEPQGAPAAGDESTLAGELRRAVEALRPQRLVLTAPGDWRVLHSLRTVASSFGISLSIVEDRHFYGTVREFTAFSKRSGRLVLETFYRKMRRQHGVLMHDAQPLGERWNFDADNRGTFGAAGPSAVPPRAVFKPDGLTADVIALVEHRFAHHPGTVTHFAWPVTRDQALASLQLFVEQRLPYFGRYQDAMWTGEAWAYHSHLSAALNLKLLNAREVVEAATAAFSAGRVPLASVEGFIRQILGWREYVRGVYWTQMPKYLELNALQAHEQLPAWYWTGATDMVCLHDVIVQTLQEGYAHHIQRLMVTGLYALLLGVEPQQVHQWYLAVYVDAVEWAELPNVIGMSQYADGGLMGSKPYVASGKYIQRMSNYCKGCRYDPALREGAGACPFTTLYWDFLLRHETLLAGNRRMALQMKNLARLSLDVKTAIKERAAAIRRGEVGTL